MSDLVATAFNISVLLCVLVRVLDRSRTEPPMPVNEVWTRGGPPCTVIHDRRQPTLLFDDG